MDNKFRLKEFAANNLLTIILFIVCMVVAIIAPGFLTIDNLLNIFRNISLHGVIAFGMTMVIICGEIDLSISSTVAVSGILTGVIAGKLDGLGIMPLESSIVIGMIVALLFAAALGLFNGIMRTRFNIPTFIVTLAMMNVVYGLSAIWSHGFPVTTFPSWFRVIGSGRLFNIVPIPAIILLVVFAFAYIIMEHMKFGREIYTVGGNPESARLSGVNVARVKISVMMIVQLMAALAGIMTSAQVMSAAQNFGKGWEMDVIASVIIGGASLSGGVGKVSGTFAGLIFLGVLLNGMTLLNVNEYTQYVVRGALILIAVLINTVTNKNQ